MASPSRSGSVARYKVSADFKRFADVLHVFLVAVDDFVFHGKVVVRIDRAFFGHKVADMSVRSQHVEVFAQVFFDGFGFGRGFYDDEVLAHACQKCKLLVGLANSGDGKVAIALVNCNCTWATF